MTLIRIVYWKNDKAETMDIDHTDWITKAPNTILKLFIQKAADSWIELAGKNAYIIRDIDGVCFRGSVTNSELSGVSGQKRDPTLETLINPRPSLKFGIAIPDNKWAEINSREFV